VGDAPELGLARLEQLHGAGVRHLRGLPHAPALGHVVAEPGDALEADDGQREGAVALALHLYAIDEISRRKCLEAARAAGSTTLDAQVSTVEDEIDPPDEALQPLLLADAAPAKISELIRSPPTPSERLRAAAVRHRKG
jgi:hypothetical protein